MAQNRIKGLLIQLLSNIGAEVLLCSSFLVLVEKVEHNETYCS
jgi:hypothetical protein